MIDAIVQGAYFGAIAVVLAMVEIQIEGKDGWAANLPTWRWGPDWFLRWSSRPVTGYHVWMISLLLLFCHLPMVYLGWSVGNELRVLSLFFIFTIIWDVLWFILNPAYGYGRFARHDVWWYRHWLGPFPTDYWLATGVSLALWLARGWWEATSSFIGCLAEWGAILAVLIGVTILCELIFGVREATVTVDAAPTPAATATIAPAPVGAPTTVDPSAAAPAPPAPATPPAPPSSPA